MIPLDKLLKEYKIKTNITQEGKGWCFQNRERKRAIEATDDIKIN